MHCWEIPENLLWLMQNQEKEQREVRISLIW